MRLPKKENKEIYKKQVLVALEGLLAELPNLVFSIILAFKANSILCWIDTVVSLSCVLHYSIVSFVSFKMTKSNEDKYNYGLARLEVFTSFICDLLISLSMVLLLGASIYGLFVPQFPTDDIFLFMILKIGNTTFDVYFLINGIMIAKKRKSRLNETEVNNYLNNLIHDALIMVAVFFCYIFKDSPASTLISPIVGIISVLYFLYTYIRHIRLLIKELADISIPVDDQDEIFDIVLANKEGIKRLTAVNCHMLNNKLFVDVVLSFNDEITYDKQIEFLKTVQKLVEEKHSGATVRLVFENNSEE